MAVIEAIATTYLEAEATSVEFTSIPGTYEHLQLRMNVKDQRPLAIDPMDFTINGDTTAANYSYHIFYAYDSVEGDYGVTSSVQISYITGQGNSSGTASATAYASMTMDILDYANPNKNTVMTWTVNQFSEYRIYVMRGSQLWDSTAAVTSLKFEPSNTTYFTRGSEFTLYGLNSA